MALTVKHTFNSLVADDPAAIAAGEVLPSHWNSPLSVTGILGPAQGGLGVDMSASNGIPNFTAGVPAFLTTTGSGTVAVLATSPTLTTPILGFATVTTINKVTITQPAASATLTIANTKGLTVSNTLTLTGTDGSSVAFGTGGTVLYANQTITLTGDVTGSGTTAIGTTVAVIGGTAVGGSTGTGSVAFSASPTFTGTVTAPLVNGGAGAASTLTLQSTSGAGTTDAINFKVGSQVTRMSIGTAGLLTINQNATAPPLPFVGGIQLVIADGITQGYVLDTFAANGNNVFRRANGTNAVPSQLSNNDIIGALVWRGYDGSAAYSGNSVAIQIKAAEDWIDATHHGSTMILGVTPAGTASQVGTVTITGVSGSNRVGIGTETNPQATLVVSANVTTGIVGSIAGPLVRLVNADGVNTQLEMLSFTASAVVAGIGVPNFFFTTSGGTAASPSGVKATQVLGQFGGRGFSATGAFTATVAQIQFAAVEDFVLGQTGTYIAFRTTPIATAVTVEAMRITSASGIPIAVGIGTAVPDAPLTISANTAATVAPFSSTNLHIVGADGLISLATHDTFGSVGFWGSRRADGTLASKSAVAANSVVASFFGNAWDGTVYNTLADIRMLTQNLQSGTDHSSAISFRVTPVGTTTLLDAMRITSTASVPIAIGIGTTAPDALLTVDANTGASVTPIAGTNLHIVGADATANRITMHSYGTVSVLGQYHSQGTQASKSATASGNNMFAFGANGWNGSAYVASSEIDFFAGETFSGTASGGYIRFQTTPLTTTGVAEAMRIQPSGGVSIGSSVAATDPGLGSLLVQTSIKVSNTAATNSLTIADLSKDWSAANAANLMVSATSYADIPRFAVRRANGTAASPTATLAADVLGQFGFRGFYTSGGPAFTATTSALHGVATENHTSVAWGAALDLYTVPNGTTTPVQMTRFQQSGGVSIGPTAVATDTGLGNLLVQNFINTGGYTRTFTNFSANNTTTLTDITNLSATVVAGKNYGFLARLFATSNVAAGVQAAIKGTATATNLIYSGYTVTNSNTIAGFSLQTTLGSSVGGVTAVTTSVIEISGEITVNAGGTLTVQFAQNVANGIASVVLTGSWFKVWQIT